MGKKALKKIRSSLVIASLVAAISLIYNQDTVFGGEFPIIQDCTIETDAKIVARLDALKNLAHAVYYKTRVDIENISPEETILKLRETYMTDVRELGCEQYEDGRVEVIMEIDHKGKTIRARGYGYPWDPGERFPRKHFPPVVLIQTPMVSEVYTNEDSVLVRVVAEAVRPDEPITDISVYVNGKRVDDVENRDIDIVKRDNTESDRLHAVLDATVHLIEGDNFIKVTASNKYKKSAPKTINVIMKRKSIVTKPGKEPDGTHKPQLYILSIGISEYKTKTYNLDYAHKDAIDISNAFNTQKGGLYTDVYKKLLVNENAKRNDIMGGLEWLLNKTDPENKEDIAIIFISGHGLRDVRGTYYFFPHDGIENELMVTAVKWHDFLDALTNLPQKTILMVDTCHSGSIVGEQVHSAKGGAAVIAASTGEEIIPELPEYGHGAFTQALLEGLEGKADWMDDGTITLSELGTYITYRVQKLTDSKQSVIRVNPTAQPDFPLLHLSN